MSLSATFYTLSKRKNSTKQPTGTGTVLSVDLKSGTSYISPTFLLNISGTPTYNYLQFEGCYYFIKDKVSIRNNLWELVCEVDALATVKTEILNTHAYVLYDNTANTQIPDNRIPIKTTATVSANTVTCPFVPDSGCYILSLTGAHDTTGIYKTDSSGLAALIDDMQHIEDNIFEFSSLTPPTFPTAPTGGSVEDYLNFVGDCLGWVGDWIKYAIDCAVCPISQFFGSGNIPQNIRECRFIPFNVGTTGGSQTIYLGSFKTLSSLAKLNTKTVHRTVSVSIPWPASDYRRRSPYTELYLYLPYIGMTRLSSENLVGINSLTVAYTLGLLDGSMIVTVSAGSEILGQYSANVASSVPVGWSNINIPRAAQSVIAGVAAAYAGSPVAAGMAALNFGDSVTPNYTCVGGLDGVAGIATNQNITCYSVFHDTVVAPNTEQATIGSPSMCPKALTSLTGYCQCLDAHVEGAYPSVILDMVDSYLNNGFFIE